MCDKTEDVGKGNNRHGDVWQEVVKMLRKRFEVRAPAPQNQKKEAGDVDGTGHRHLDPECRRGHGRKIIRSSMGRRGPGIG
jgi:hypothetical protein